jgi:XTP/dITP diphosphohydrolase
LLSGSDWQVRSCESYEGCPEPEETGDTFEENALIKARAIAAYTEELTLADDSGLEVDALDGAPGVHSARYSGPDATDASNNALLLQRLADVPDEQRTARFCCVIAIVAADGRTWTTTGTCEGRIGTSSRGDAGFGYDPLFTPEGHHQTFGELGADVKNSISHRGKAVRAACALLDTLDL